MLTCIASKKVDIITDSSLKGQHTKIRALKMKAIILSIIVTDKLGGILK